jgi:nicotinamidase-related amidase
MGRSALIVVVMINTYDHDDADLLLPSVAEVVPTVTSLLEQARENEVPVI